MVSLLAMVNTCYFAFELGKVVDVGLLGLGFLATSIEQDVGICNMTNHLVVEVAAAIGEDRDAMVFERLVDGVTRGLDTEADS